MSSDTREYVAELTFVDLKFIQQAHIRELFDIENKHLVHGV